MSAKKIVLLIGLPGSGKTTLGNLLKERYEIFSQEKVVLIDDIGVITNDAKSYLLTLANDTSVFIITDVYFCKPLVLKQAQELITSIFPNNELYQIFFENNPQKCLENIEKRKLAGDSRKVVSLVKALTKEYNKDSSIKEAEMIKINNYHLDAFQYLYVGSLKVNNNSIRGKL